MNNIPLPHFLKMLKFRPKSLIGRQIIYNTIPQIIYDISLDGRYILLDKGAAGKDWYPVDEYPFNTLDDPVVIDERPGDIWRTWETGSGSECTVSTIMLKEDLERQKRLDLEKDNEVLREELVDDKTDDLEQRIRRIKATYSPHASASDQTISTKEIVDTLETPIQIMMWNPTHESLGNKVFPLINKGYTVTLEGTAPFELTIQAIKKEELEKGSK